MAQIRNLSLDSEEGLSEAKEKLLSQSASLYMNTVVQSLEDSNVPVPAAHHRQLVEWMKKYVASDQYLALFHDCPDRNTLHARAEKSGVEGELASRIGPRLFEIVTGEVNPLLILLEGGLLYRAYADDSSIRCYAHMASYLCQKYSQKSRLRALEVGAGTGEATQPLLEAHSDRGGAVFEKYDYTDISAGFFARVAPRFQGWSDLLEFRKLDLETDPSAQGFAEASYDLIVASNVVHATKNLATSLANIRKLLRPEGHLALLEVVRMTPTLMMTYGVLPGWWAGTGDGRTGGPLVSTAEWNKLLLGSGFRGVEVERKDWEGPSHKCSLMISGVASSS